MKIVLTAIITTIICSSSFAQDLVNQIDAVPCDGVCIISYDDASGVIDGKSVSILRAKSFEGPKECRKKLVNQCDVLKEEFSKIFNPDYVEANFTHYGSH